MKRTSDKSLFRRCSFYILLPCICPLVLQANELQDYAQTSRDLIQQYAEKMDAEYLNALQSGEYTQLKEVCLAASPKIAGDLSKDSWTIRRIITKSESGYSVPDSVERMILADFRLKLSEGWPVDKLAYYKMTEMGNSSEFRYVKAIPSQKFCMSCHAVDIGKQSAKEPGNISPNEQVEKIVPEHFFGAYAVIWQEVRNYFPPPESDAEIKLPEYQE